MTANLYLKILNCWPEEFQSVLLLVIAGIVLSALVTSITLRENKEYFGALLRKLGKDAELSDRIGRHLMLTGHRLLVSILVLGLVTTLLYAIMSYIPKCPTSSTFKSCSTRVSPFIRMREKAGPSVRVCQS